MTVAPLMTAAEHSAAVSVLTSRVSQMQPPGPGQKQEQSPARAVPLFLDDPSTQCSTGPSPALSRVAVRVDDRHVASSAEQRTVDADLDRLFGRQRTPRTELPDPGPRAAAAVRLLLEVLGGDRPPRQVAGWVSAAVLAGLESRAATSRRALPRRPVLRSVRVSEPADGVAEVCAVVQLAHRYRAVALRLDGLDGRWTVTALHVG